MLKIIFGPKGLDWPDRVAYVSNYFDAQYEASWLQSDMAKRIIKTIDDSEYVSGEFIQSPVLGGISPRDLSTGCKALLIILNEPDTVVSGDRMGDNCYPLLLEIAKDRDVTITLCHYVDLQKYEPLDILNVLTGEHITTALGVMEAYVG